MRRWGALRMPTLATLGGTVLTQCGCEVRASPCTRWHAHGAGGADCAAWAGGRELHGATHERAAQRNGVGQRLDPPAFARQLGRHLTALGGHERPAIAALAGTPVRSPAVNSGEASTKLIAGQRAVCPEISSNQPRAHNVQGVRGSSPLRSTIEKPARDRGLLPFQPAHGPLRRLRVRAKMISIVWV